MNQAKEDMRLFYHSYDFNIDEVEDDDNRDWVFGEIGKLCLYTLKDL